MILLRGRTLFESGVNLLGNKSAAMWSYPSAVFESGVNLLGNKSRDIA